MEVKYKGKSIYDVLNMTVEEALGFFDSIPSIKRKIQTLYDVGLSYIRLGQPSTELSGGEAQRIKLATELSKRSTGRTIYILDEPTAALDPSAEYSFFKNFRNNILDKIGIFVTHRFSNVKIADNIFVLKDGKLIEQGTHKSLMNNKGDYAKLYNIQIGE